MSADWVLTAVHTDPRCDTGDQWFEFTGTGHGADVGACRLYAAHCTRLAEPPECTSWYNGVWSITTEDGDVINITFHGRWLQPGRASEGLDVMTVVGGTGPFDRATGEMEGELYPDWREWPPTLTIRQTIRGWIRY
jgi:hypothetical protein